MSKPMTAPTGTPPITAGDVCEKCGKAHDPSKCQAHSKLQQGGQCQLAPMTGQRVCGSHGGRARQSKAAAATRTAEQKIRQQLGKLTVTPVENPLLELQTLAGEARAWKELCAEHVANLERMRYGTEGGEAIRGEVVLFERAMDRCLSILATIAKLNIDERLAEITIQQKQTVIRAIDAALSAAGVDGDAAAGARKVAARHLRLAASA